MTKIQKDIVILVVIVAVIAIVWAAFFGSKNGATQPTSETTATSTVSVSNAASTASPASTVLASSSAIQSNPSVIMNGTSTFGIVSATQPFLLYSVTTDKKTYTQNEQIDITLSVLNNSDSVRTFDFVSGCQGTYSIDGFNMLDHMRCLPGPSSAVMPAHGGVTIPLVYYPAVSVLPVGTYPLYASLIGYGGATTTVTITK
ncbi:MAG: hypothetical protein P4L61_03390 [Candidatus Pacebacteria bacterium]|nr:hypothetical protein [Candidatus Paceibacterota bacterium]